MNKEEIYDECISPLMAQILDICKESGINMFATFSIPTEESEDLACTSLLAIDKEADPEGCKRMKSLELVARHGWIPQKPWAAFTITTTKTEP